MSAATPLGTPLLDMDDVSASYGDFQALFNITLQVWPGEIVTLIGANGSGKTTTLRTVSGLLRPKKGTIKFAGETVNTTAPHDIVNRGVAHVPEGRQLFPFMSVEENLILGGYIDRIRPKIAQKLEEQYTFFPKLKERRKQLAGTLSGGEQQMVAISRGLMAEPKLLLLDEPSLGLAPKIVEEVFQKIQQIGKTGVTVLIVEQNVVDGLSISDRGYVVENGAITMTGQAKELLGNEQIRAAYL